MPGKGTVWLVSQYVPASGETWRPHRSLYLARSLVARGYDVIQWSATFNHHARKHVAGPWEEKELEPGFKVRFVPNTVYRRNVSVARLRSQSSFAKNFGERAMHEEPPVCIIAREPPIELGEIALKVGEKFDVPVVSDLLDLWPEFFHRLLPRGTRNMGRVLFGSLYERRRRIWSKVDGLCAVSQTYVEHAIREEPSLARVPTACIYTSIEVDFVQERLRKASEIVSHKLGEKPAGEVWVGYTGYLGLSYDIPVLLRAADILRERGSPVRFVVAGVGPFVPHVEAAAAREGANVAFLGLLAPDDLYPLLGHCDLGLLSYSADTTVAIPDKFYDYAAAGLPVINSLQGEVKGIIEGRRFGVTYAPGDAEALANAIEALARDPAQRAAMGARALEAARSWDAPEHFERFADVVEESIRRRSGQPEMVGVAVGAGKRTPVIKA